MATARMQSGMVRVPNHAAARLRSSLAFLSTGVVPVDSPMMVLMMHCNKSDKMASATKTYASRPDMLPKIAAIVKKFYTKQKIFRTKRISYHRAPASQHKKFGSKSEQVVYTRTSM